MIESIYDGEFFDPEATLACGQVFRWERKAEGFRVYAGDKACFVFRRGSKTVVRSREEDEEYFFNYFDLGRDYAPIAARAAECGFPAAAEAARFGRGIRILNQEPEETIFSFILSQNNHIPRIRAVIGRLCAALGEKRDFGNEAYCAFPKTSALAAQSEAFYRDAGCGYRAKYMAETARRLAKEGTESLAALPTPALRERLTAFSGVGPKVADCIALFGFHRTDAFPVDTWIEKVYREEFGGKLKDRKKIAAYFAELFGGCGGYIQQYLFYSKRERR